MMTTQVYQICPKINVRHSISIAKSCDEDTTEVNRQSATCIQGLARVATRAK